MCGAPNPFLLLAPVRESNGPKTSLSDHSFLPLFIRSYFSFSSYWTRCGHSTNFNFPYFSFFLFFFLLKIIKLESKCNIDFFRRDYSSSLSWICTGRDSGPTKKEISSLGRCLAPCFLSKNIVYRLSLLRVWVMGDVKCRGNSWSVVGIYLKCEKKNLNLCENKYIFFQFILFLALWKGKSWATPISTRLEL